MKERPLLHMSEKSIEAAAILFDRIRGVSLSTAELKEIETHFGKNIDTTQIKDSLLQAISSHPSPTSNYRSLVYWALGKLYDRSLLVFFQQSLKIERELDLEVAYQVMIALDNLDEPVFSRTSLSVFDHQQNDQDALRYLKSVSGK